MIYKATGTTPDGRTWIGVVAASNLVPALRLARGTADVEAMTWRIDPIYADEFGVLVGGWTE